MLLISKSMRGLKPVRHSLMSWSVHSLFLYRTSHRYVVENGNNIDKEIPESSGNPVAVLSQKIERLFSDNFSFRVQSHEKSISCASFAADKVTLVMFS